MTRLGGVFLEPKNSIWIGEQKSPNIVGCWKAVSQINTGKAQHVSSIIKADTQKHKDNRTIKKMDTAAALWKLQNKLS